MQKLRAAVLAIASTVTCASAGVIVGQVDHFEDGTTMGWGSGANNPNPPVWAPGAGPTGFDDGFLVITGNGMPGPGGQIVAFNSDQWTGDYIAAGVTAISMFVQNFSHISVEIGLRVEGPGGTFASVAPIVLPSDSFWDVITIPITPDSLSGGGDVLATLSNVTRLRIQDARSPLEGSIGVDNITAVPEPASIALLAISFCALRRRG